MLKIIKIGGNIVDNCTKLQEFLTGFVSIAGPKILVHGGGKTATRIAAALGVETVMIEGRRITDGDTLKVVNMVYNAINKQIVGSLQALGSNAVGLCGADGRLIVSKKRSHEAINYGYVGDPVSVNVDLVQRLVDNGYTLVVAPLTLDEAAASEGDVTGGLLNTNADTIAQILAVAMAAERAGEGHGAPLGVELIYCFEKQGVLLDVDDDDSVISRIDKARFAELKATGAVHSGMLPKLENAFYAIDGGVESVVICAAENIAKPGYGGTTIVK